MAWRSQTIYPTSPCTSSYSSGSFLYFKSKSNVQLWITFVASLQQTIVAIKLELVDILCEVLRVSILCGIMFTQLGGGKCHSSPTFSFLWLGSRVSPVIGCQFLKTAMPTCDMHRLALDIKGLISPDGLPLLLYPWYGGYQNTGSHCQDRIFAERVKYLSPPRSPPLSG